MIMKKILFSVLCCFVVIAASVSAFARDFNYSTDAPLGSSSDVDDWTIIAFSSYESEVSGEIESFANVTFSRNEPWTDIGASTRYFYSSGMQRYVYGLCCGTASSSVNSDRCLLTPNIYAPGGSTINFSVKVPSAEVVYVTSQGTRSKKFDLSGMFFTYYVGVDQLTSSGEYVWQSDGQTGECTGSGFSFSYTNNERWNNISLAQRVAFTLVPDPELFSDLISNVDWEYTSLQVTFVYAIDPTFSYTGVMFGEGTLLSRFPAYSYSAGLNPGIGIAPGNAFTFDNSSNYYIKTFGSFFEFPLVSYIFGVSCTCILMYLVLRNF